MTFDPNPHHLRLVMIRCGQLQNPQERNVTTLYEEMTRKLGVIPFNMSTLSNNWEAAPQLVRQILITAGQRIRELQSLLPEEDLEKLAHDTAIEFGLIDLDSAVQEEMAKVQKGEVVSKLPAPHEMKDEQGKFIVPRKDCPQCGEKESMILGPLCTTCEDAKGEDGKQGFYKSMWQCIKCSNKDKSEKRFVQWLTELGVDFGSGTKESMGIRTYTNNGFK